MTTVTFAELPAAFRNHPLIRATDAFVRTGLACDVLAFRPLPYLCKIISCVNIDSVWTMYRQGHLSVDELAQFYKDMGYSLGSFVATFRNLDVTHASSVEPPTPQ
jgi:hypothetical protein